MSFQPGKQREPPYKKVTAYTTIRMASETGTKSVSGTSPGHGNISTATTTVYYRSLTDKETGAVAKGGIYYNDAATGNVVKANNGSGFSSGDYNWSYNIAENQLATQSESV